MKMFFLAAAVMAATCLPASATLLRNGDFETNSAVTTQFSVSNADFSAFMDFTTGFGTSKELDIITGTAYGIEPQSGNWKVGMHQRPGNLTLRDEFSFDLLSPMIAGQSYALSFAGAGLSDYPWPPIGTIEIGISTLATSFGTLVFSGKPTNTASWTMFSTVFTAPISASYLTVSVAPEYDGYSFVDNFTLSPTTTPVPLPGGIILLGSALAGFRLLQRRRA